MFIDILHLENLPDLRYFVLVGHPAVLGFPSPKSFLMDKI